MFAHRSTTLFKLQQGTGLQQDTGHVIKRKAVSPKDEDEHSLTQSQGTASIGPHTQEAFRRFHASESGFMHPAVSLKRDSPPCSDVRAHYIRNNSHTSSQGVGGPKLGGLPVSTTTSVSEAPGSTPGVNEAVSTRSAGSTPPNAEGI